MLTLYGAADLLTAPGCPVCRYAGEAADRYLGWFALEGHAQPDMITRLCGSLGMCPRHTRALMGQAGAATRLPAVYRYVLAAAQSMVSGRAAALAACPACEHDDAAAERALGFLLEGLEDREIMGRYRELGGLCLPHLRAATARKSRRIAAADLASTVRRVLSGPPGQSRWLAGTDHDALARAALRRALPAAGDQAGGDAGGDLACRVCMAAARSGRSELARVLGLTGARDPGLSLCGEHLADAVTEVGAGAGDTMAGVSMPGAAMAKVTPGDDMAGLGWLLSGQAGCLEATGGPREVPARPGTGTSRTRSRIPFRRSGRSHRQCPVCGVRTQAAARALAQLRESLRGAREMPRRRGEGVRRDQPGVSRDGGRHWRGGICVRHLLSLRTADSRAAEMMAPGAAARAGDLAGELTKAFELTTWARRGETPGRLAGAFPRAALFLDGGVFGGCPPGTWDRVAAGAPGTWRQPGEYPGREQRRRGGR